MESRQQRELAHWQHQQTKNDEVWGWQTPSGVVRAERRADFFRQLGEMTSRSVVLEIGCGTGEFTRRIAPHVGELVATDLTPEFVARTEQRIREDCPGANVSFVTADAMNLGLPDNKFDAVFGCSILHHLDASAALREMFRVLKPGGRCVFSEPNMLNPQIALQKNIGFIKRKVGDTPDESAFFKPQITRLLRHAGFDRISVQHFDFLHPLVPRSLISFVQATGRIVERVPGLRAMSGSLLIAGQKSGRS